MAIDFSKIVRAYDVRGIYPQELNEEAVAALCKGFVAFLKPKTVVLGMDVRTSGPALKSAAAAALTGAGVKVIDIGTTTTDMIYFAVGRYGYDGGISITGSHNPREYNGMKMVARGAAAISSDTGLKEIKALAERGDFAPAPRAGTVNRREIFADYLEHLRGFGDLEHLPALKIVGNANFGMAGKVATALLSHTNARMILLNGEPDGNFPKGRPDPLIKQNRAETTAAVRAHHADLGVAWDSDADRCFFYDETGTPLEGYYTVALLAQILLREHPGEKIIHDPRLVRVTQAVVREAGGVPIEYKTGHAFIKNKMRQEDALFAGEMSGHYYFRDNFYADNGMIPFVIVLGELARTKQKLSALYAPLIARSAVSGELNFTLSNPKAVIGELKTLYKNVPQKEIDGLSVEHTKWRFNLRASNTEPLVRLNVEAKKREEMEHIRDDLIAFLKRRGAQPAD